MRNQKGFGIAELLLLLVLITLVAFAGWYVRDSSKKTDQSLNNANYTTDGSPVVSKTSIKLNKEYLPFTLQYPEDWEISNESTTDYGFYSIYFQVKGTVIESGRGGSELKSGSEITLIKTSDKSVDPETSVEEYSSTSDLAKYMKNKKTIIIDGTKAIEFDLDRTSEGGTSGHQVAFYKDDVWYFFDIDSQQYSQSKYATAFNSIVKSLKFK